MLVTAKVTCTSFLLLVTVMPGTVLCGPMLAQFKARKALRGHKVTKVLLALRVIRGHKAMLALKAIPDPKALKVILAHRA